ncbi:MAG: YbjN domain-containing protein [Desulfitobacteriaceae bacterium]|nr:YbjN domain-containing protein [Desulfitobacteriaceae bacterium]MDI6915727.1 YbjN domain-containing protein [Desulfitobacteriaceae bacterium]
MTESRDGAGSPMNPKQKSARVVRLQDYQEDKEREEAMEQTARSLQKTRQLMAENYQVYLEHLEGMDITLADYEEDDRLMLVGDQTLEENLEASASFMIQFNLEQPVIDIHMIFTPEGTLKHRQKLYRIINSWNQDYRFAAFFLDGDNDLVVRTSLDVEHHFEPTKLDEALILLSDLADDGYTEVEKFWVKEL